MDINQFYRFNDENEKPLDNIVTDGGFTAIFRTIACIGDSLSSGELESETDDGTVGWHDYYEHSWGQYIARAIGSKVHNFSCGGMRADWYCKSFAEENGFWDPSLASEAYIFALGVNDVNACRCIHGGKDFEDFKRLLGNIETDVDFNDWRNNKDTFIGNYAKIVQRYKEIQPKGRMFLMTMPRQAGMEELYDKAYDYHAELLRELSKRIEFTYVIDLRKYAPIYDHTVYSNFFMGGHMSTMGYLFTAHIVMSYIDYIIRHNVDDFRQTGFIGKGIHNARFKW